MMIEEAIMEIQYYKSMRPLDKKIIARSCGIIRKNKDLPNELRIRLVKRLKHPHYKTHPELASLKRKLGSWSKVPVPEDNRLPRLDFDGKNFILYTGPFLMDVGSTVASKGTKRPAQGLWIYPKGSEIVNDLTQNWAYINVITDRAQEYINIKLQQQQDKLRLLSEVQDIKDADEIDFNLKLKSTPYPHQKKAIKIGTTLDKAALLMEQGTGKTLSAIAIAIQRFNKGQVRRILVVAPKSVLPEWASQLKDHTDLPYKSVALNMKKAKKLKILKEWTDLKYGISLLTINYESLDALKDELIKWQPDMMILDESQNIKESRTKSAKACYYIADKADIQYRLILTGTPVSESPLDFFGQYRFLDPSIFGYSYAQFRDRYAKMDYWGSKIKELLNTEELASKAHSIAYRVTKKEALKDLPPEKGIIEEIVLDEYERNYYNQMEETSYLELNQEATIAAPLLITQLLKLQQLAGGFIKDEEGIVHKVGDSKLTRIKGIIRQYISEHRKAVIFCRFTPELESIRDFLSECGVRFEVLNGDTKDRGQVLHNFKEDPDCLFFLAQIRAGGVGITLTAASTAIFYSTGYSSIDYEQAKARIHRIGQTKPVTYIHLVSKDTLDETIYQSLADKKQVSDLLVDQMKHINSKHHKEGLPLGKLDTKLKELRETMKTKDLQPPTNTKEDINMSNKLNEEVVEQGVTETAKKDKKGKKAAEAKAPKEEKAPKAEVVTLSQIAEELGSNPAALRRLLRGSEIQKPEGRWEWPVGHEDIQAVKDLYNTPAEEEAGEEA